MPPDVSVIPPVPSPAEVHEQIGRLLRALRVARRLLKLAELADTYRTLDSSTPTTAVMRQGVRRG
jgi:hypothetical protein